jgi:hypothetical protein
MRGEGVIVSQRIRAVGLAALVGLLLAGATRPAEARPIPPGPTVDLASAAGLAPDGSALEFHVLASCPDRWTVVEASVAVTQGQSSGEASFPLTCTGASMPFRVTVHSSGAPFQLGEAQATASVVIKRGRTEQAEDSETVRVVPTVVVDLADTAALQGGGQAVSIGVTTACNAGAAGGRSYVTITQSPVSGTGTFTPVCDGQPHTFGVTVQASQGLFQAGTAQGSAFVTAQVGGDLFFGEDNHPVEILMT